MMNVLFVCRANIGRSQAAVSIYNKLGHGYGYAGGTKVYHKGHKLKDLAVAKTILRVMWQEYDINMGHNTCKKISKKLLDDFDKIIVMSELSATPNWLINHPKTIVWDITDPLNQSYENTKIIVSCIENNIHKWVGDQAALYSKRTNPGGHELSESLQMNSER